MKINDNRFSGTLPSKCSLMLILDVSNNMLDKIPTWICNQTNLDVLSLRNNFLKCKIPCETIQIQHLDLSQNFLSGSLPSWTSERLEHMLLGQNNFSGSIPKYFLNISGLLALDISDNRLSGRISSAIGKLFDLSILLLGGNRLSGTIPTQLCQLILINLMDLSSNLLSGTIPHCFHQITYSTAPHVHFYDGRSAVLCSYNYCLRKEEKEKDNMEFIRFNINYNFDSTLPKTSSYPELYDILSDYRVIFFPVSPLSDSKNY